METTKQQEISQLFKEIERNSIMLHYGKPDGKIPCGASKFGGNPDLPKDFEWFYYEGRSYDEVVASRPLSFLAQINLEDVKPLDTDQLLPEKGILYFFYEMHSMKWGFDPKDKGCARVYYYGGPVDQLEPIEAPADLEEEFLFPELPISFSNKRDMPDYNEFVDYYYRDCKREEYEAHCIVAGYEEPDFESSKLLGYTDVIQNPMLYETERVVNGIFSGDNRVKVDQATSRKLFRDSKEWIPLFQMGTVSTEDFELMFCDCGLIYFLIRKGDLAARNFDNTWLILQCY